MISKFIMSRFSGYIALAGLLVILGLIFYIYNEGKKACVNKTIYKTIEVNTETRQKANEVRKIEQNLTDIQLDNELCSIGIVRERDGCK